MFSLYNLFKFVHVVAVIIWVGGMIALAAVNSRLAKEREHAALRVLTRQSEFLGRSLIGPSAITTLLAGIVMTALLGQMTFWMGWGLVGVVGSIALGAVVMQRQSRKLEALTSAASPDPGSVAAARRRLAMVGLLNIALLLSTVGAMVFKPTL